MIISGCLPAAPAVFGGAHFVLFSEFLVKVIHVFIAHLFRYLVDFHGGFIQQANGFGEADMIQVAVEVLSHLLVEQFSQIGAVVAEEGRDALQFQGLAVVLADIVQDIVEHAVAGVVADGADDHLELFREVAHDLVEISLVLDQFNDGGVGGEGDLHPAVEGCDGLFDLQEDTAQEVFDLGDFVLAGIEHAGQFFQRGKDFSAVIRLDIGKQSLAVVVGGLHIQGEQGGSFLRKRLVGQHMLVFAAEKASLHQFFCGAVGVSDLFRVVDGGAVGEKEPVERGAFLGAGVFIVAQAGSEFVQGVGAFEQHHIVGVERDLFKKAVIPVGYPQEIRKAIGVKPGGVPFADHDLIDRV